MFLLVIFVMFGFRKQLLMYIVYSYIYIHISLSLSLSLFVYMSRLRGANDTIELASSPP